MYEIEKKLFDDKHINLIFWVQNTFSTDISNLLPDSIMYQRKAVSAA